MEISNSALISDLQLRRDDLTLRIPLLCPGKSLDFRHIFHRKGRPVGIGGNAYPVNPPGNRQFPDPATKAGLNLTTQ